MVLCVSFSQLFNYVIRHFGFYFLSLVLFKMLPDNILDLTENLRLPKCCFPKY